MVLEQEPELTAVRQAASLAEARTMLDGIDIAIVDLALPDGNGTALIEHLHARNPEAMALVLTASLDQLDYAHAIEAGAAGVLHKSVSLVEIKEALRRLRAGEWLLSPKELAQLLRLATRKRAQGYETRLLIAELTPREREVLEALADGLSSQEIAERLSMTVETERTHMVNILSKLGVHSRLQALVFAVRHGVVTIR